MSQLSSDSEFQTQKTLRKRRKLRNTHLIFGRSRYYDPEPNQRACSSHRRLAISPEMSASRKTNVSSSSDSRVRAKNKFSTVFQLRYSPFHQKRTLIPDRCLCLTDPESFKPRIRDSKFKLDKANRWSNPRSWKKDSKDREKKLSLIWKLVF